MKMQKKFLSSKVARRVFALFISCALVPILAVAIISFSQVRGQLYDQAKKRLHQSSKSVGMSIFERLMFLENELKLLSSSISLNPEATTNKPAEKYAKHLKERFKTLARITGTGDVVPLFGALEGLIEMSDKEKQHLRSGQPLLTTKPGVGNQVHIYMMRGVNPQEPRQGVLCGEINSMYLWGLDKQVTLPSMTDLCILDKSNNVLFSSIPLSESFSKKLLSMPRRSAAGQFDWKAGKREYLASYWDIFTKSQFLYPRWTAVLSVPKDYIFSPIAYFKKIFPLVILLSFWVVLLLSVFQIRKTMDPLEKLKDGTQRIAKRDFDTTVAVESGDEFEELAVSFNDMARQLGRLFNALTTMSEIDRAVLSALETKKIMNTAITGMQEFLGYEFVGVALLDLQGENPPQIYAKSGKSVVEERENGIEITPKDLEDFIGDREIVIKEVDESLPRYLVPFSKNGIKLFITLPLIIKNNLAGIIALGSVDSSEPDQEDLDHARQLADQVAVAQSNAQLIKSLEELIWGILETLADLVDLKSRWTAGHSTRVTEYALKVGEVLGLTQEEMDDLKRGGLLHDIGKIGIPSAILDKAGKLTDEEYGIIKSHPRAGARVLEHMKPFAPAMLIVLHHHEHFNGNGYPDGLAGDEISLGGRILAVVDVFDALISDRPYRKGMDLETTLSIIKKESGKQFDPNVVQAFLKTF